MKKPGETASGFLFYDLIPYPQIAPQKYSIPNQFNNHLAISPKDDRC
ncbi:hypothetical protein [Sediminicola arcticus]